MGDKKSGADWLADWQALQQQYWTSMGDMARKAGEQAQVSKSVDLPKWHEGLEIWTRAFQGGRNGQSQLVERALEHGKAYLDMLQRIGGIAARPAGKSGFEDWTSAFTELMKGMAPGVSSQGFDALGSASAQGARGIEQMMADIQPMISMLLGEARGVLGMQPFGMAREHQERQQALAAAVLDYQQASAGYQGLLARSLARGVELFEQKLAERSEPGRHIESPKALYDLWIDAAEEGYAEVAMSPEFQDAYGALVNTQMRVRQLLQDQVERLTSALGMPTRSEINSVHRKLAALKRHPEQSAELQALAEEVKRLRAAVEGRGKTASSKTSQTKAGRTGGAAKKATAAATRKTGQATKGSAKASSKSKARAASKPKVPSRATSTSATATRKRKKSR